MSDNNIYKTSLSEARKNLLPTLRETICRFPVSTLCVLTVWITGCLIITGLVPDRPIYAAPLLYLPYIFLAGLGTALLAEAHKTSGIKQAGIIILLCLPLLGFTLCPYLDVYGLIPLYAAAACLTLIAPFILRNSTNDAVWVFCWKILYRISFGIFSSLGGMLGISLVLLGLGYLFGASVPKYTYGVLGMTIGVLFFPLYVLAGIPSNFDDTLVDQSKKVLFNTLHIAVPLLASFTAIFYAYAAKIALTAEPPRGGIIYMVLAYAAFGIATHTACHLMRDGGTLLPRLVYKWFYPLLLGPLALMAIWLFRRIDDYGITTPRYVIILCLIWLAGLCAAWIFRHRTHLKFLFVSLGAMLIFAAGTLEIPALMEEGQHVAKLERLFAKSLLPLDRAAKPAPNVTRTFRNDVSGSVSFLIDRYALWRIEKLLTPFADHLKTINPQTYSCKGRNGCKEVRPYASARQIMDAWGIPPARTGKQVAEDDAAAAEALRVKSTRLFINNPFSRLNEAGNVVGYDYVFVDARGKHHPEGISDRGGFLFGPKKEHRLQLKVDDDGNFVVTAMMSGEDISLTPLLFPIKPITEILIPGDFKIYEGPEAIAHGTLHAENDRLKMEFRLTYAGVTRETPPPPRTIGPQEKRPDSFKVHSVVGTLLVKIK